MAEKPERKKSFIKKDAEGFANALKRRGIIYISKIPPMMKPNKVRALLECYGEITRIYLAVEDDSKRKHRQKRGGNGCKLFSEGWVEFSEKEVAKNVAESLNNTSIASRKRDYYHDDMWSMKYLKGFKWDYLTEKVSYERRMRESMLQASMMQAKRQNADFVRLLDMQHAEDHIAARKNKRRRKQNEDEDEEGREDGGGERRATNRSVPVEAGMKIESTAVAEEGNGRQKRQRRFQQRQPTLGMDNTQGSGDRCEGLGLPNALLSRVMGGR